VDGFVHQVALLHTWIGEDHSRVNPIQRCYFSQTPWALIITITIIIMNSIPL